MNPGTCQVPGKKSGNMMPLSGKKSGMRPAPPGICVRYGRHSKIFPMMLAKKASKEGRQRRLATTAQRLAINILAKIDKADKALV
jgi:hypothetical protein